MGKQEPEPFELIFADRQSKGGHLCADSHASRFFIHTFDDFLLQLGIFSSEHRQSIVCVDFGNQECLDVRGTGQNVDSIYVSKFHLKVNVWTRGDKHSGERLHPLNEKEELFPIRFRAYILVRKITTLEIIKGVNQIRECYQGIDKDVGCLKEETKRPKK